MSKRLIAILAFAFVVGIAFAAYAEVQNVKVSGDILIGGTYRNNFDLAKSKDTTAQDGANGVNTSTLRDRQEDAFSIVRLRVDADLTDNVSVAVRLLNERNWNGESTATTNESNRNIGLNLTGARANDQKIDLDLAYVALKEFLYSPLTVTVGRQNLRFNNGWIVGDPDTNTFSGRSALAEGDLSMRKSFDAVRATLDYNPLIVDMIFAKVAENNTTLNDDTTLSGINAAYELDKNTTLEGFFYSKVTGSNTASVTHVDGGDTSAGLGFLNLAKQTADQVYTAGARVVNKTVKNLTVDASAAYQFGTYNPMFDPNARYDGGYAAGGTSGEHAALTAPRSAWGTEVAVMYDLKDVSCISKWSPMIGAAFVYLSGDSRDRVGNKAYKGWDAMYEDQTFGHIINAIMGFSNVTLGAVTGKAKLMDDLTINVDYVRAYFNKRYPEGRNVILSGVNTARQFNMNKDRYLGQEVDAVLTYDYTEDVQFSLLGGYFLPGESINTHGNEAGSTANTNPKRAAATEVIGTMKVTF